MRKLNFNDIFAVAEIIRKAKIRQELAALIADISSISRKPQSLLARQ